MPDFAYTARDSTGRKVSGKLTAATQHEAVATLSQRELFPVEVNTASVVTAAQRGRRIKPQLMATTYGQLADLLRSGVPLLRSLEVLEKQSTNARLAEVLEVVRGDVAEGKSLAEAFARHPRVFSEMALSMVRAGGEGGFLEEALDRVADFTEKQEDMKSRTQGALAYPIFLAVIGTLVVSVLLVFFVPKFGPMFDRLRQRGELPALTDWLLATSATLQSIWLPLVIVLAIAIVLGRQRLETEEGRLWLDRLKLRVPLMSPILLNLAVARFCRVLGTLLQNGVPIIRALSISSEASGNRVLAGAIQEAAENISAGEPLAGPLSACGHFPPTVVEMIAVAEESASLDTVLVRIADGLERRTWRQLDLFVRLLEPLMLLLLAVVVLLLAIALLLPVIKMSTAI